jgi:TP901-1 family phage major tail protein
MSAQPGDLFLLKQGDGAGPEVFTTVAGLRGTSYSINGTQVDVTHKGSAGWRTLLSGGSVASLSISADGVLLATGGALNAQQALLRTRTLARTLHNYQIDDGSDVVQAAFQVTSFEASGPHGGEQTFSITLESSGAITVT